MPYSITKYDCLVDYYNKGMKQAVRDTIREGVEQNWIEFGQILSLMQQRYPNIEEMLENTLQYFIEMEDYKLCTLIYHCYRFVKGRSVDCEAYLDT